MTKIFAALLRLNRGPHSIDAASSSLLDVYTGVHRVDNPRGQTCELVCKAAPKLRACIRLEVLFRLKRRHDHFIRATCAGNAQKQQLEQARFLTRCLVVLLKYGALLSDPGQHGMLPLAVFGTLQEWGCEGEGFATPLNATLQSYCSLHSEADRCFGSLGSFFDWRPKMGSFELNPPFTIRSTAVEDHVVELLQAAERDGKALSFCYVVPETAGRLQTRKSIRRETPFLAGELMVRASSKYNGGMGQGHVYRRGNEFQTHAKQPWDCPFTTVITWFQTTAAKEKWPVTDALKRDLLTAFAPGAPEPEAMR